MMAFILVAAVGMSAATALALYGGARDPRSGGRLAAAAFVTLVASLALTTYLAHRRVYAPENGGRVPWIGVAIAVVIGVGLSALRMPTVAAAMSDQYAPSRLAIPQLFRAIGATFLIAWQQGQLPALFAIPAALGDVAIGVAAPIIWLRLRRDPSRRRGALWFNVLGILDLTVAVAIGFVAAASPYQLLHTDPSTDAVGVLPLAIIPTLLVPFALVLHVASIQRLRGSHAGETSAGSNLHAARAR
jgi:hypothetical protein